MKKLKAALMKLHAKLTSNEDAQQLAGNRWLANHERAVHNHKEQKVAEHAATKFDRESKQTAAKAYENEAEGRTKLARQERAHAASLAKRADAEDAKAARCKVRATKNHDRAVYWVGQAKIYAAKVHHLENSIEKKEDRLHKIEIESGAHVSPTNPNKVEGGTPKERVQFAMHKSEQSPNQHYSQTGTANVDRAFTGVPNGYRTDCSQWFTSIYWSADCPDPNGSGNYNLGETMYTGSLGEHGKPISESELDTGDAILFGTAPFHHVEMKDGPISESRDTVGHGSDPIDRGTVSLLPGPRAYRRFPKES